MSNENKWYADLWIIKLLSPTFSHCRTVCCFSIWSHYENKTFNLENFMNSVVVAIVSAIVLGHPFNNRVVFWLV